MKSQPDPDDTPDEIVIEDIRQGLKEAIQEVQQASLFDCLELK